MSRTLAVGRWLMVALAAGCSSAGTPAQPTIPAPAPIAPPPAPASSTAVTTTETVGGVRAWPREICIERRNGNITGLSVTTCNCGERLACSLVDDVLTVQQLPPTGGEMCTACRRSEETSCAAADISFDRFVMVNGVVPVRFGTSSHCQKLPALGAYALFASAPILAVVKATSVQEMCIGAQHRVVTFQPHVILRGKVSVSAFVVDDQGIANDVTQGDLWLAALQPIQPVPPNNAPQLCIDGLPASDAELMVHAPLAKGDDPSELAARLVKLATGE